MGGRLDIEIEISLAHPPSVLLVFMSLPRDIHFSTISQSPSKTIPVFFQSWCTCIAIYHVFGLVNLTNLPLLKAVVVVQIATRKVQNLPLFKF